MSVSDFPRYEEHRFNDDLLTNRGDVERAKREFPAIIHVLDDPYLREIFKPHDEKAKAKKKTSQFAGLMAIVMGAAAMIIASAVGKAQSTQILEFHTAGEWFVRSLGIISLIFGVLSILFGWFGVLHGKAKRDWLCRRVITERLRQFHFQAFCCRWPEIVLSLRSEAAQREYTTQRRARLDPFKNQLTLHAGAELTELLDDESQTKCWLHPVTPALPAQEGGTELVGSSASYAELQIRSDSSAVEADARWTEVSVVAGESRMQLAITPDDFGGELDQVFAAYRELRIMHQLHYANYKLQDEYSIFGGTLRMQAVRLSYWLLLCTLAFFLIHSVIAVSLTVTGNAKWPILPFAHLAVVWIAIAALAAHAFQEGLQPEREIERYRQYRAAVRAVRDRFDRAASALAKIEVMREMERLSFDEFRNFLRSVHEARFIM